MPSVLRLFACFLASAGAFTIPSNSKVQTAKNFEPAPFAVAQIFAQDNDHTIDDSIEENPYQQAKDRYLAASDRKAWCADRCLATGYCDVLEDIYELTTEQVMKFCKGCSGADECELIYANAN